MKSKNDLSEFFADVKQENPVITNFPPIYAHVVIKHILNREEPRESRKKKPGETGKRLEIFGSVRLFE